MSAWWLIVSNNQKPETQIITQAQKILPRAKQNFKEIMLNSEEVESKILFNESGLEIDEVKLKNFSEVEVMNPGFLQINFLDAKGNFIEWSEEFNGEISNDSFKMRPLIYQVNRFTRLSFLKNSNNESPSYIFINYKIPPGFNPEKLNEKNKLIIGYTNAYWGHLTVVDEFIEKGQDGENFWVKIDPKRTNISTFAVPLKIKELKESGKELGIDLLKILHLNSGFPWIIKGFLLYHSMNIFDYLTNLIRNPLWAIMLMLLISKIVLIYPSYRSHLFNKSLSSAFSGVAANSKNPEIAIQKIQNSLKVSFGEQIIWMILKITSFLLLYTTIQRSPSFYKCKFLWINDLSGADSFNILGFLGFANSFLKIGLTPLISTVILTFEFLFKGKEMKQNGAMIFIVPGILLFVFSKLATILCLYMTISTLMDQGQSIVFEKIRKKTSRKR